MKILIVNTMGIQVISAIRSLTRLGHEVSIAIPIDQSLKRQKIEKFFYPQGLEKVYYITTARKKEKFRVDLLALIIKKEYDVLLPFGFETTIAISAIKHEISVYINTSVADFDLIQKVHDKEILNRLLHANQILVPKIYEYNNLEMLKKDVIHYPIVVKARKGCGIEKGVRYANNVIELEKYFLEISSHESENLDLSDFSKPMIQEYVPGKIYDGCFVCNHGEIVASLLQVREVTYPLSGGVGTNIITIDDKQLLHYCSEILMYLKWHGPCQVEVKKDTRTGTYKLIEINPKLWGTLGLSIEAGVDFSLKACEVAMNIIKSSNTYTIGLKYKILFPLEIYTIYQDKGNRWHRFLKLFEIYNKNVRTEFLMKDLKPNIYIIIKTIGILMFKRKSILPKGKEFE